jgi:hypothetical protein
VGCVEAAEQRLQEHREGEVEKEPEDWGGFYWGIFFIEEY